MYYYSAKNSISDQETTSDGTGNAANCCSRASSDLKLYQAFIFSVPIFFTFILLLLFYFFYLRRRRVDWSSLRMRSGHSIPISDDLSRCELGGGLKKELREMLPIIVFNESFSVKDTLCSVCLGEYQGEERLQQIPGCGHTFHMECIDLWLATHTTCPLCRQSLVTCSSSSRSSPDENGSEEESNSSSSTTASVHDQDPPPQTSSSETNNNGDRDERIGPTVGERDDEVERDIIIIVENVK
ncbi:hypothetical protein ABFS82_03G125700 [Erythranthe guttata]|uniref:RING-type E3 ubiquitin transferase n=1 Tax=Erythranthe guttata TaxID=4155 RepID=A0A022Q253_ERYGU|nr:PREDICTED: RING-H2 finger protein ATL7-like [Erythranthe guttata]EYU22697.1 hypothetical protein MIMGU_mgv1a012790mg [Erythranthe guttata]|eukprot:XP_012854884.1 PREDICTED: RING-H2 finger protein ATL7-like [Erythranthe guttata]